jgi:Sigma-70, region 4
MHVRRSRVVSITAAEDIAQFDIASEEPSPECQVSDRQQLRLVAMAIGRIKEPCRSAFLMRVINGLAHAEIGRRLGMSENAVQKSNAKTLNILMAQFGRGRNRALPASPMRTVSGDGFDGKKNGTSAEIDAAASAWAVRIDHARLTELERVELERWVAGDVRKRGALARAQAVLLRGEGQRAPRTSYLERS